MDATQGWDARVAAVWAAADELGESAVLLAIDELVAERPADDPAALFEAASARDYVGLEPDAEPLYRRALDLGLDEPRRGQAVIQLASTLRNLARHDEALALLEDGFGGEPQHPLADAARAFAALTLASKGEHLQAAIVALDTLSHTLPAYGAAVRFYAADLLSGPASGD